MRYHICTALVTCGLSFLSFPLSVTATTITVQIANYFFNPTNIIISPGDTILWTNTTATFHDTRYRSNSINFLWQSPQIPLGGTFSFTFTNTGYYPYYCFTHRTDHPEHTGTVSVVTATTNLPSITAQPTNQTVSSGSSASFGVTADGPEPLSYQWHNSDGFIPDATNAVFSLNPALTNHEGNYFAVVSNSYGQATSAVASLTVFIPASIDSGPFSQVVAAHDTANFAVGASGYPALNFQWLFNGVDVPGATSSSLVITNVGTNHLGSYWVEAWNAYSSTTSAPAALLMSPSIRAPFVGGTAVWGHETSLMVGAIGSGDLSYQWYLNGSPVGGGTNATLYIASVQFTNGGLYSVVISSAYGSITNIPYQLVIYPAEVSLGLRASLTIGGVVGYSYEIQYSTDLADTNSWISVTNLTLTQPVEVWVDTSADVRDQPKRYYKVLPQ